MRALTNLALDTSVIGIDAAVNQIVEASLLPRPP